MSEIEADVEAAALAEWSERRDWLVERLRREPKDLFGRVTREHLRIAWNDRAPEHMHLDDNRVAMEVHAELGRLTSKDIAYVSDKFSRAVAAIGAEVRSLATSGEQLTQADYARAPIYMTSTPRGVLIFTPGAGSPVGEGRASSYAETALDRLANVLPEAADDSAMGERLNGLEPRTARAVLEVAEAAKRVQGLSMSYRSDKTAEPVDAVMTTAQARDIEDLLSDSSEQVEPAAFTGTLDGMRMKRRAFYLELDNGTSVSGVIDEDAIEDAKQLIDQRVHAVMQKVTRTTRGQRTLKPTYRLLSVQLAPDAATLD